MRYSKVKAVIAWANQPANKPGQPILSTHSTREHLIQWLVWNDGNGCYTDDDARAEGHEPLTLVECWGIVESIHDRETANA
jgi:hypothetical protein